MESKAREGVKVFSLSLKDERVEQCLRACVGVNSKCGVQSKRRCDGFQFVFER